MATNSDLRAESYRKRDEFLAIHAGRRKRPVAQEGNDFRIGHKVTTMDGKTGIIGGFNQTGDRFLVKSNDGTKMFYRGDQLEHLPAPRGHPPPRLTASGPSDAA